MRNACFIAIPVLLLALSSLQAQEMKRVSKAEAVGAAITKVQPEYPVVARQLKLEGTVEVEASITETGTVADVRQVSGNPVLAKAASDALKKWKFNPFQDGGKPVKALATLSFAFAM
jgi:protein TonB